MHQRKHSFGFDWSKQIEGSLSVGFFLLSMLNGFTVLAIVLVLVRRYVTASAKRL